MYTAIIVIIDWNTMEITLRNSTIIRPLLKYKETECSKKKPEFSRNLLEKVSIYSNKGLAGYGKFSICISWLSCPSVGVVVVWLWRQLILCTKLTSDHTLSIAFKHSAHSYTIKYQPMKGLKTYDVAPIGSNVVHMHWHCK